MKAEAWNRFVDEALVDDFDEHGSNVALPFKKLTKKYGRAYIEYLQVAWQANDGVLTVEEFCKINGDVPRGFFDKKIA